MPWDRNEAFAEYERESLERYHGEPQAPSITDHVSHWAHAVGQDRTDCAWLLSSFDTWEANPFYEGPAVPHPEDYPQDDEEG